MLRLGAVTMTQSACGARTTSAAVPASPARQACASRRRRPFCSSGARGIPRPADASERRRLLPGSRATNANPCSAGERQFRDNAPPTPRPLTPGAAAGRGSAHYPCPREEGSFSIYLICFSPRAEPHPISSICWGCSGYPKAPNLFPLR